MILTPYTTIFNDNITYYCKVVFDDDSIMDLKSNSGELTIEEWTIIAENSIMHNPPKTEPFIQQDSPIESTFKAERDRIKIAAITSIFSNPSITQEELLSLIGNNGIIDEKGLLSLYINNSFNAGLITENTFESFRNWTLTLTIGELMAI